MNKVNTWLWFVPTRAFFVMVCTIPFNFSRYPPLLRVKDPIFLSISEQSFLLSVSHMSDPCCNSEIDFQKKSLRLWPSVDLPLSIRKCIIWYWTDFQKCAYFVLSGIVGKQNSAKVKSEASGLHPTKIDEDEIAPQEICKDDCDSAESDNNMYFGGIW